jgi:hypothetical protein
LSFICNQQPGGQAHHLATKPKGDHMIDPFQKYKTKIIKTEEGTRLQSKRVRNNYIYMLIGVDDYGVSTRAFIRWVDFLSAWKECIYWINMHEELSNLEHETDFQRPDDCPSLKAPDRCYVHILPTSNSNKGFVQGYNHDRHLSTIPMRGSFTHDVLLSKGYRPDGTKVQKDMEDNNV